MLSFRVCLTLYPRREASGNADIPIGGFSSLPPSYFSFFCLSVSASLVSPPSVSPISSFYFPVSAFKSYPFCFDILAHSFALAFLLKRLESSNSALFPQNTGGGGYPSIRSSFFRSALWVVFSRRVSPFPPNTCGMQISQPLSFYGLPQMMGGTPYVLSPHTRSATVPSMRLKKKRPPTTMMATTALEARRSRPGACPRPVMAQRKSSMTPAMGLRP